MDDFEQSIDRSQTYEPSYEIVPIIRTPEIDPGDDIIIDLYWAGYGVPDESKLHISHSGLSIDEELEVQFSSIAGKINIDGSEQIITNVGGPAVRTVSETADDSMVIKIDKNLFFPSPELESDILRFNKGNASTDRAKLAVNSEITHGYDEVKKEEMTVNKRISEQLEKQSDPRKDVPSLEDKQNAPPIQITIPTKRRSQDSGTFTVSTTLTYTSDKVTYTSKDSVDILVKDWVQRHKTGLKWIAVTIAFLTLLLGLLSFGANVYDVFIR